MGDNIHTPWRSKGLHIWDDDSHVPIGQMFIGDMKHDLKGSLIKDTIGEERASFVARAVNSHEELVNLLKEVLPTLAGAAASSKASEKYSNFLFDICVRIKEALSKAEQK